MRLDIKVCTICSEPAEFSCDFCSIDLCSNCSTHQADYTGRKFDSCKGKCLEAMCSTPGQSLLVVIRSAKLLMMRKSDDSLAREGFFALDNALRKLRKTEFDKPENKELADVYDQIFGTD